MKSRKIIVLIGTDGTGKTTVSTKLESKLSSEQTEYAYLGMKLYKFPLTQRLHDSNSSLMQGLFKYVIYPYDIFSKRRALPKNKNIIIDRLPGYPFSNKSKLLKFIYSFVIPKIDVLIWLHGTPEVIYQRKQERNPSGLIEDQKKIKRVFENVPAKQKIDISVDVLSADKVSELILKECSL